MQNISNINLEQSSATPASSFVGAFPMWWNSSGLRVPQSSLSENLNQSVASPAQNYHQMMQLGCQLQDRGSPSTQSSGQSYQEVDGTMGRSPQEQFFLGQSGRNNSHGLRFEDHMVPALSVGTPEVVFPTQKIDLQSIACIPYPYGDPYYGSVLAAYAPHATIHPQVAGRGPSARVPLPCEPARDVPIYVNAKQYPAILRRRRARAKLETQNKFVKGRKPYLHESRHLHALNRARGSGGRFLNANQQEQQLEHQPEAHQSHSAALHTDADAIPGSAMLQLDGGGRPSGSDVLQSGSGNVGGTVCNPCPEVTGISDNGDIF